MRGRPSRGLRARRRRCGWPAPESAGTRCVAPRRAGPMRRLLRHRALLDCRRGRYGLDRTVRRGPRTRTVRRGRTPGLRGRTRDRPGASLVGVHGLGCGGRIRRQRWRPLPDPAERRGNAGAGVAQPTPWRVPCGTNHRLLLGCESFLLLQSLSRWLNDISRTVGRQESRSTFSDLIVQMPSCRQAKLAAVPAQNTRPRLAELVGVAARACDVGIGLPIEHTIRTCLISVELGRRIGLSTGDLADLYYLSLLRMLGCTAGSAEAADLFSDEVKFGADTQHLDYGNGQAFGAWVMANFGSDRAPAERQAMIEHLFTLTPERHRESSAGHCEVAQLLARRIGVSSAVVEGLAFAFERFDGTGRPFGVPGPNQPLIARVVALCNELEVHNRLGGPKAAETMARDRAGGAFDPDLVAAFCADRDAVLAVLEPPALWESWLAAEPGAVHHLDDAQVREAARAIGDFGDLKSHFFAGHATAVAQLADDAAERAGLDKNRRTALQLAALLHDVGRVAVTTAIWDKPAMLNDSEWEKVRLHPYYSERCLARAASLTNVATIVGKHHERLDGSGYHRGDARNGLAKEDRILAAADAFAAMRAVRPHRPPLDLDLAGRELRAMAERDLLDAEAVNCVLAAAGDTRAPVRRTWPAGLTDREVDVLREIAIGSSIQQAAGALQVSAKTVDFHLQNVYAKAGITTRAAAALFAVQHDLLNA